MSFDIFAMHLPEGLASLDELDPDWSGPPIGSRNDVVAAITRAAPHAELEDDETATIHGEDFSIEIYLGDDDPVESFSFSVRGIGEQAVRTIAAILREVGCGAVYAGAGSGIFSEELAQGAFEDWQDYRDHVLETAGN